jgi:acyl-coenzyme A synthetase/AMP-(fatty) acid ligase
VHRGALVSLGYWNDAEKTALRFRPAPLRATQLTTSELAVWSGDTVVQDEEGYLYFVGRHDEMIKTSGYRVSPTEIEEVLYATGFVAEAIAFGVPHPVFGQAIVVVCVAADASPDATGRLLGACRDALPTYMVPAHIEWREVLPRNANGKIDRPGVAAAFAELFTERG